MAPIDVGLPGWLSKRGAGVLLHPSSLPGGYGIGSLGREAYKWIDFLASSGFTYWQMCPVGPTGYGDSPYQVFSSSAGNPYFIDLTPLVELGYLDPSDLGSLSNQSSHFVDYGNLYTNFFPTLRIAHTNFLNNPEQLEEKYGSIESFKEIHAQWLEPFAKYQSIKAKNDFTPWWEWNPEDKDATHAQLSGPLLEEYHFQVFQQYLFRAQWNELRQYAKVKKISLIGDLPIYVAPDSADTWHNRDLFQIDKNGKFEAVAGVPPDYFNENGQLWGNPLYNWEKLHTTQYDWWVHRIKDQLELFDVIRIDHFRAFHDFWSIPRNSDNAKLGKWEKGPGLAFWETIKSKFPTLPFLAEDLGEISKGVLKLRTSLGLPGMAVLQFAFDGNPKNAYLPHNLTKDLVLYTGTHDNDTSCSWYDLASEDIRSFFRSYLNIDGSTPGWDMLRCAYRSTSQLVIVPAQDLLSLGHEARFNTPGTAHGNWHWRMTAEQFGDLRNQSAQYLREQALLADRIPKDLSLSKDDE